MSSETCIFTTKDFTILEIMRDRCLGREDPLAPILKRKIESALVVFRDDMPVNVATLSSRVSFSVEGRDSDTRVLSYDRMNSPVGMFLPINTGRGLALLGLTEGQEFRVTTCDGIEERIMLEKVRYQPEAAKRDKEDVNELAAQTPRKPALRLIRGTRYDDPGLASAGHDDPDPSAA